MDFTPVQIESYLKEAIALARAAGERDEVPVGAILVLEDVVVGRGGNRREETSRTTAHAEIVALEEYNREYGQWRLPKGSALFVTAEPCLMCTGALLWARVDHIFYGCSDPKQAGLERVRPLIGGGIYDHKFASITGGVLKEVCSGQMSDYFKAKRAAKKPLASL